MKQDLEVSKIFIFGSYSRGQQHVDSDIDVAIVSPDFTDNIIENQVRLMKYRRTIDLRIEPRPFKPVEFNSHNPLAREIMETGIELLPKI
ncbi:MAG: nucleotidyltransferase domain-containing protein [Clostridiales bacterium]|nr:nucleotidyltransferase domain-containing protein [Clostridiales bacterium]